MVNTHVLHAENILRTLTRSFFSGGLFNYVIEIGILNEIEDKLLFNY